MSSMASLLGLAKQSLQFGLLVGFCVCFGVFACVVVFVWVVFWGWFGVVVVVCFGVVVLV